MLDSKENLKIMREQANEDSQNEGLKEGEQKKMSFTGDKKTIKTEEYYFEDGSWYAVRPSGTEPKIKFYFSIKGETLEESQERLKKIKEEFLFKLESIE